MIEPKTYWEERCEVLEGFVTRLSTILIINLPATRHQVTELVSNWETILTQLEKDYKEKVKV